MRRAACLLLFVGLVLSAAIPALAHVTRLSGARLEVRGAQVQGAIEAESADLQAALASAPGMSETDYLRARVRVTQAGVPCPGEIGTPRDKGEHRVFDVRWECPPGGGRLVYDSTLFHDIDPATRHMVTAKGDISQFALLSAGQHTVVLGVQPTQWRTVLVRYFLAGLEHILIGFDHVAFVIAAVAWGRRLWPLIRIVTAFTVAHSITLALAALDLVTLSSVWVEAAIAASIVYVAVENFRLRSLAHRAWITFAFGLVHGFGFASVLRDYGLPEDALIPALAAFNAGVEAGQVAVVVLALGLLAIVERQGLRRPAQAGADPRVVGTVSGLIAVLGAFWLVERLSVL